MFGTILLLLNLIVIVLLFTKYRPMSVMKRIGIFSASCVLSFGLFLVYLGYFIPPNNTVAERLVAHYEPAATNVQLISAISDKTKSDSYILIASFTSGNKQGTIKMPVTRLDGFDAGWHADSADIEYTK